MDAQFAADTCRRIADAFESCADYPFSALPVLHDIELLNRAAERLGEPHPPLQLHCEQDSFTLAIRRPGEQRDSAAVGWKDTLSRKAAGDISRDVQRWEHHFAAMARAGKLADISGDAYMTIATMADRFGVDATKLRRRLDSARASRELTTAHYRDNPRPGSRGSKLTFKVSAAMPYIEAVKSSSA